MRKVVFVLILLIMLNACSYTEPNTVFTVTAVGISANEQRSEVVLKIKENEKSIAVIGVGNTLEEALNEIKTKLSGVTSFGHCQLIAVSDVSGEWVSETLSFCRKVGVPLRTKIIYTKEIEKIFEKEGEITPLLKQSKKEFGFGDNTALFEIETAILINKGDFALPIIVIDQDRIKIEGLLKYKNSLPYKALDIKQSTEYAEEVLNQ